MSKIYTHKRELCETVDMQGKCKTLMHATVFQIFSVFNFISATHVHKHNTRMPFHRLRDRGMMDTLSTDSLTNRPPGTLSPGTQTRAHEDIVRQNGISKNRRLGGPSSPLGRLPPPSWGFISWINHVYSFFWFTSFRCFA